jgi:hypothetical protein
MDTSAVREHFVKSLTILVYDRSLAKAVFWPGCNEADGKRLGNSGSRQRSLGPDAAWVGRSVCSAWRLQRAGRRGMRTLSAFGSSDIGRALDSSIVEFSSSIRLDLARDRFAALLKVDLLLQNLVVLRGVFCWICGFSWAV